MWWAFACMCTSWVWSYESYSHHLEQMWMHISWPWELLSALCADCTWYDPVGQWYTYLSCCWWQHCDSVGLGQGLPWGTHKGYILCTRTGSNIVPKHAPKEVLKWDQKKQTFTNPHQYSPNLCSKTKPNKILVKIGEGWWRFGGSKKWPKSVPKSVPKVSQKGHKRVTKRMEWFCNLMERCYDSI